MVSSSTLAMRFSSAQLQSGITIDRINHADNCGIDCRAWASSRGSGSGPAFAHHHHHVAYSGIDRVEREKLVARIRSVGVDRSNDHYSSTFVPLVLLRCDDVADYSRENHLVLKPLSATDLVKRDQEI